MTSVFRFASLVVLGWVAGAFAQSDPLVAKSISPLLSDDRYLWAFGDDGTSYSLVDLAQDPPAVTTHLDALPPVEGGMGRTRSVLAFYRRILTDTTTLIGLLHLDRKHAVVADSVVVRHTDDGLATPVFSAMAIWRDTVLVASGRAGFLKAALGAEGQAPFASKAAVWSGFAQGRDSLMPVWSCTFSDPKKPCPTTALDSLGKKVGGLEAVHALAIDSAAADSAVLWLGTGHGLYKTVLGAKGSPRVEHVPFPGVADTASLVIRRIAIEAQGGAQAGAQTRPARIWAFSSSRFAVSLDQGASFHLPPKITGRTDASAFTAFNATPEVLMLGDTTWVNFNLDRPGLVLFRADTVLTNAIASGEPTELGDVLLDAADSLNLVRGEGQITQLATVAAGSGGAKRFVVAATSGKGLFYRAAQGGAKTWSNLNRQTALKNGLGEIITFPTLFTAAMPDGHPDYVTIGYRLKKDAKVTITIYNHAMEKVRTVVSNAPRKGNGARAENPLEDRWDGRDSQGRRVSVGTYYVRVESSTGVGGWGKILAVAGRK